MRGKIKYILALRRSTNCVSFSDDFKKEIQGDVNAYCRTHKKCTYDELCSVFGNPGQIGRESCTDQDFDSLVKHRERKKWTSMIAFVLAIVALCASYVIYTLTHKNKGHTYIITNNYVKEVFENETP